MYLTHLDVIRRQYDIERLVAQQLTGEGGGCCSSYDCHSPYNAETDTYEECDANDNDSGFIRREGEWLVAFERARPRAIWHEWSALPATSHIQIFIDNAPEPDYLRRAVPESVRNFDSYK